MYEGKQFWKNVLKNAFALSTRVLIWRFFGVQKMVQKWSKKWQKKRAKNDQKKSKKRATKEF